MVHEKVECLMLQLFISLWNMHLSSATKLFNISQFRVCMDRIVRNKEYGEIRAELKQIYCLDSRLAVHPKNEHFDGHIVTSTQSHRSSVRKKCYLYFYKPHHVCSTNILLSNRVHQMVEEKKKRATELYGHN